MKLTQDTEGLKITDRGLVSKSNSEVKFKIAIDHVLGNNYQFKNLKTADIKMFSNFIKETVGKNLSISMVNKQFLRKQHLTKEDQQYYAGHEIKHFGKDRTPFRIFGYYNDEGYFCIHQIDPKHKINHGA